MRTVRTTAALVVLATALGCNASTSVLEPRRVQAVASPWEPPIPPLSLTQRVPLPETPEACTSPARSAFLEPDGDDLHVVWESLGGGTCWARLGPDREWRGARELGFETVAFGLCRGIPVFVTTTDGTSLCTGFEPSCTVVGPERPSDVVFSLEGVLLDYGELVVDVTLPPPIRLALHRAPVLGSPVGSFHHRVGPCAGDWVFLADDGLRSLGAPGRRYALPPAIPWPPHRGLHVVGDRSFAFGPDGVAVDVCTNEAIDGPADTAGFYITTLLARRGSHALATVRRWAVESSRWYQYEYRGTQRLRWPDDPSTSHTVVLSAAIDGLGSLWLVTRSGDARAVLERWSRISGSTE
ncbi:MAG TPA: hypothetical protein RMH99_02225 [Sandaracinaceae bacterium LLY-WYZ-13_1]|nr:hypothetical protein [Sandaracinaceae bacterium LLY-WYZ-13_1]